MKRAAIYLLLPVLAFCGLWSCSPLAMATVPGAVQTLATGGAGCLGTVGLGLAGALLLLGAGGAWRLAHPSAPRPALLYTVEPRLPGAQAIEVLEGEYEDV